MRILVTGGAGYVGSVSVEHLVESGHEVVILDNGVTENPAADLLGAALVRGSYGDRPLVADLLATHHIEAILHCAARSLVGQSMHEPALYYGENVAGGLALLDAMRDASVGRLVISSTAAVYGEPESSPISENAPVRPINVYGETKRTLEAAAGWYGRAYGLRVAALRYFNVAGASSRNGEVHDPETHLIPNIIKAVRGGPPLNVWGDDYPTPDGTPIRDYLHVVDLAEAHRLALEATAPGDARSDAMLICNLGSGRGFSVREVIAAAERVIGQPVPRIEGPRRAGDPPALVAAIDRARDILGSVTTADVSNEAFPFSTCRSFDLGGISVLANRLSYVGELGWEIYCPMEEGARLWDVLWEAGQAHGLIAAGMGVAGTTARLEKGYRAYGAELELDFTLVEAGLARPTVKAADFNGKAAYLEQRTKPPVALLCTLSVDDHTSASGVRRYMLGHEPILTADGQPITDARGRRSYVTSAGAGPSVGKHLLMAYLPPEHAVVGTALSVNYLGERYPVSVAIVGATPLFDPTNERIRG